MLIFERSEHEVIANFALLSERKNLIEKIESTHSDLRYVLSKLADNYEDYKKLLTGSVENTKIELFIDSLVDELKDNPKSIRELLRIIDDALLDLSTRKDNIKKEVMDSVSIDVKSDDFAVKVDSFLDDYRMVLQELSQKKFFEEAPKKLAKIKRIYEKIFSMLDESLKVIFFEHNNLNLYNRYVLIDVIIDELRILRELVYKINEKLEAPIYSAVMEQEKRIEKVADESSLQDVIVEENSVQTSVIEEDIKQKVVVEESTVEEVIIEKGVVEETTLQVISTEENNIDKAVEKYQNETHTNYLEDLKEKFSTQEEVFGTKISTQQEDEIIHKKDNIVPSEVYENQERASKQEDTISMEIVERTEEEVVDKQKVLNIVDVNNLLLEFEKKDVDISVEVDKVEEDRSLEDTSFIGYDKLDNITEFNLENQRDETLLEYKNEPYEVINVSNLFSETSNDRDVNELKVEQIREKEISDEMIFEQEKQSLTASFQSGELNFESSLKTDNSEHFQSQSIYANENLSDVLNIDNLLSELDNDKIGNLEFETEIKEYNNIHNELDVKHSIQEIENFELKDNEAQEMLVQPLEEQKLSIQNVDLHDEIKDVNIEIGIHSSSEKIELNDILADIVDKENFLLDQNLVDLDSGKVIKEEPKRMVDNWDVSVEKDYKEEKMIYDIEVVDKHLDDTLAKIEDNIIKIEDSIIKVEGIDELAAILEEHQKEMVTPSLDLDIDLSNLGDMEIDLSDIDLSDINIEFSENIDITDIGQMDSGSSVLVDNINQQEQQDIEKKTDTDNKNGFVYSQDIEFKVKEIQKGFLIQDIQKIIILRDMEYAYYSADNKIDEWELVMLKNLGNSEFTSLYFEKGKNFGFILNEAKTMLLIVFAEGVQVGPMKLKVKAIKLGG
ncbi:MAG: hypothetical protein RMJ36_05285 [Candidatus Calescibacterium sp.]|nr:hypothetical protein [Candidatus Calescibacterium sp.]MDW8133048.1 hypothetical protein [Candidatus Calescibacterium sp.]